jgi:DNA polymerase (family X)
MRHAAPVNVKLDRFAIARALQEIAALLELSRGYNRFKARAYVRAAEALEDLTDDLGELVEQKRLKTIPGVGEAIASQIRELALTGTSSMLERLRSEHPPGVLDLMKVPNLGVKKIAVLHRELGVRTIEQVEEAARAKKIRALPGFGPKTEAKILEGIERYRVREEKMLRVEAMPIARRIVEAVRRYPGVEQADLAGELRRGLEAVSRIEIVATVSDAERVAERFKKSPWLERLEESTDARISARHANGLIVDLHLTTHHAVSLIRHTGPIEHVAALEERGKLAGKTEEAVYEKLGLPYIPPEYREDPDALTRDVQLIEETDLRGVCHCHTTYSDGKDSILEMAQAAEALGYQYITITDHSAAAYYAGGLDEERLLRQWDELEQVQEHVKIKLLRGTEADILTDGAIDWPERILEQFDIVIASVHSGFKMDEDTMTARLKRAMRDPIFKVWGHALGRLVERRAPYAVRMEEVFDVVAESNAAIELNGDPYRLDPEPKWIRSARKRGIKFMISTDAHSTGQLRNAHFGVTMARRGGLTRDDVLNTNEASVFKELVSPLRGSRGRSSARRGLHRAHAETAPTSPRRATSRA